MWWWSCGRSGGRGTDDGGRCGGGRCGDGVMVMSLNRVEIVMVMVMIEEVGGGRGW